MRRLGGRSDGYRYNPAQRISESPKIISSTVGRFGGRLGLVTPGRARAERHWKMSGRWQDLYRLLDRQGPLAGPNFVPGQDMKDLIHSYIRILVVGAGGLGCELLKDLTLLGFLNLDVIDMDRIELTNLNRQFLFRKADVGKPKAEVAAAFINKRVPGANVIPHFGKIQDKPADFYRQFQIIVLGLDSLEARRWMNDLVCSFIVRDENGEIEEGSNIPMVHFFRLPFL